MKLNFKKYHGCYNEFICMDMRDIDANIQDHVSLWCQKKYHDATGYIGADGVVVVQSSDIADVKMMIVNADGSIPEMCGNGLRCLVAFMAHQQIIQQTKLTVETLAGVLDVTIQDASFPRAMISVGMGTAIMKQDLPLADFSPELMGSPPIQVGGFDVVPVSMGNPHAVIFVKDVDEINVSELGPLIQNLSTESGMPYFPNGVNVEFVAASKTISNALDMRVFERGVGETMACGTGACAAVVAGVMQGVCTPETTVILPGGFLDIHVNPDTLAVTMTGPAECMPGNEIEL